MVYDKQLQFIFYIVLLVGFYFQIQHLTTPLLDQYAFRQTQTAITSYWFIKEGFQFAYQTPVFGFPWSVPMEFPIYQYIVYVFSKILRIDNLDLVGRLINLSFYYALLYPLWNILKNLEINKTAIFIILIVLVSSPIYIFWSRTFMIESTGLYFTLMFIMYVIRYDKIEFTSYKLLCMIFIFGILSILTKITTLFVGLVFLSLYTLFYNRVKYIFSKKNINGIIIILVVVFIGFAWNEFANTVKESNPLSTFLISGNLSKWNFGTLEQRLDITNYITIFNHMFHNNSYSLFLLFFIPGFLFCKIKYKRILIINLLTYLISFMVFFNLYKVHGYYWYANSVFLVIILGLIIYLIIEKLNNYILKNLFLLFMIIINIYGYYSYYYKTQITDYTKHREVFIGDIIKNFTADNEFLLTFGLDWDSSLPYYSQRKALMNRGNIESLSNEFQSVYNKTTDIKKLGAVVLCDYSSDNEKLFQIIDKNKFEHITYNNCEIYIHNIKKDNIQEYIVKKELDFFNQKNIINSYVIKLEDLKVSNAKRIGKEFQATNNDMYLMFQLPKECIKSSTIGLEIQLDKKNNGFIQFFYKKNEEEFSEEKSLKRFFQGGNVLIQFAIVNENISYLRIDPTEKIENVLIDSIKVYCK